MANVTLAVGKRLTYDDDSSRRPGASRADHPDSRVFKEPQVLVRMDPASYPVIQLRLWESFAGNGSPLE